MASESTLAPVNGSYGAPPQYNAAELPAHSTPSNAAPNGANGQNAAPSTGDSEGLADTPSKDEVGWYFVEQYYTTMSKTPEKLHLFYAKKSQFVSGVEDEKVTVSIGQKAIGDRIKALAIEECKVRVTNVDSQESLDQSIVVQVIGEMWMKSEPHRKFVQTFVLAKQLNGYYVLNDILRYLVEDDAEEEEEAAPTEPEAAIVPETQQPELPTLPSSNNLEEQEKGAEAVDKLLEKSAEEEPAAVQAASAAVAVPELPQKELTPEPEPVVEDTPAPAQEVVVPEIPKDPEPSPVAPSPKVEATKPAAPPATQEPVAPSKPAAPKTWASMLGGAKAVTPAVPVTPTQPKKAPAPVPAAVATTPAPSSAAATAAASSASAEDSQPLASPGGWQTAGQEHNKKQNRGASNSISQGSGAADNSGKVLGYIKNVTERVDGGNLKTALLKYGKLDYFDISRQKNCAFVEFADRAGYEAAVAANPHNIDGEAIYVEERRPRGNAYGGQFGNRGGIRGGGRGGNAGVDNRQAGQGGRGGFQKEGGRGNYTPRGRGNLTPRGGRGGMTQAA